MALQLQVSEGSFQGGLTSILSTFSRRTYANPELFPAYAESLRANPWAVMWTYVADDRAIGILGVRFLDVILVAAGITVLYLALARLKPGRFSHTAKSHALIAADMVLASLPAGVVLRVQRTGVRAHPHQLPGVAHAIYPVCLPALRVAGCAVWWRDFGGRRPNCRPAIAELEVVARLHSRTKNTRGRGLDRGCFRLVRYAGKLTFGSSCIAAFTACSG